MMIHIFVCPLLDHPWAIYERSLAEIVGSAWVHDPIWQTGAVLGVAFLYYTVCMIYKIRTEGFRLDWRALFFDDVPGTRPDETDWAVLADARRAMPPTPPWLGYDRAAP